MTTLLQTKAFHRIPPANIQAIFMRMQRINYRAGDVVIKQGTEGDYFYVVVAGKCVVMRETPLNKIHIRNMYRAADAGATIFPLIPAFYYRPTSLDDIAREFAYRVLAHLALPQPEAFHWKG